MRSTGADILVVDDEADIRELVSGLLEDEGHAVRTASNSDEAIAAIRADHPDARVIVLTTYAGDAKALAGIFHAPHLICRAAYAAPMVELLCFWMARVGAALLELRLLRSSDGGFRVMLITAAIVVIVCLALLSFHA
mgnify:CR=1 FL=1